MPSNVQHQAIIALYALGRTNEQIATVVGVEIGDVESVTGGATFDPPGVPLSGGGGSPAGAHITHKFPFAFDTPGLLTGATAVFTDGYAPAIGDLLIDAWIEIDTAWDGTTPKGDIGTFVGGSAGWFANNNLPLDFSHADAANGYWDASLLAQSTVPASGPPASLLSLEPLQAFTLETPISSGWNRALPAKWVTADPIKVVVSQDGTITGADPGAAQGTATLYVTTARL